MARGSRYHPAARPAFRSGADAAAARPARAALLATAAVAALLSACGADRRAAGPSDCAAACEHLLALAHAELERTAAGLAPELRASLVGQARAAQDGDRATCVARCGEGHLDTGCARRAKTYDGAASCTKAPGAASGAREPADEQAWKDGGSWIGTPTTTLSDRVGGVDFSVELPRGLKVEREGDDRLRFDVAHGNPWANPSFELELLDTFPASEATALAQLDPAGKPVILRQELKDGRYTLVFRNDTSTSVVAQVLVRAGERALSCRGTQSKAGGLPDLERIGDWFASTCATLRPR